MAPEHCKYILYLMFSLLVINISQMIDEELIHDINFALQPYEVNSGGVVKWRQMWYDVDIEEIKKKKDDYYNLFKASCSHEDFKDGRLAKWLGAQLSVLGNSSTEAIWEKFKHTRSISLFLKQWEMKENGESRLGIFALINDEKVESNGLDKCSWVQKKKEKPKKKFNLLLACRQSTWEMSYKSNYYRSYLPWFGKPSRQIAINNNGTKNDTQDVVHAHFKIELIREIVDEYPNNGVVGFKSANNEEDEGECTWDEMNRM